MKKFLVLTFSTWFGSGYSPIMPGTAGTALAVPFALLFTVLVPEFSFLPGWSPGNLVMTLVLFYPAVLASSQTEIYLGRHDPGLVVVDEALGFFLTMAFFPTVFFFYAGTYVWAFFIFRLLDFWKPGWIRRMEAFPRGWGIMLDDILAGFIGGVILAAMGWFWPELFQWGDLSPWINELAYKLGGG